MSKIKRKINWFDNSLPFDKPLVDINNITYPSVNHFYYAQMTNVLAKRWHIANQATTSMVIRAVEMVEVRPDWMSVRDLVMRTALNYKFAPATSWALRLRNTEGEIVNANNTHDVYWGCCECSQCYNTGRNMLGVMLMNIRSYILSREKKPVRMTKQRATAT
jgi:hypothetical protein